MSALGDKALAIAQGELAAGVRGGAPGWGRFRGPRVDEYLKSVGLQPDPRNQLAQGWPWCAAFVYWCFRGATVALMDSLSNLSVTNRCPRTASALHLWQNAPQACQGDSPLVGSVVVLDRGEGKGHCGIVQSWALQADGTTLLTTVEGDTSNRLEDAAGDAVGRHEDWNPQARPCFTLVGYLTF